MKHPAVNAPPFCLPGPEGLQAVATGRELQQVKTWRLHDLEPLAASALILLTKTIDNIASFVTFPDRCPKCLIGHPSGPTLPEEGAHPFASFLRTADPGDPLGGFLDNVRAKTAAGQGQNQILCLDLGLRAARQKGVDHPPPPAFELARRDDLVHQAEPLSLPGGKALAGQKVTTRCPIAPMT